MRYLLILFLPLLLAAQEVKTAGGGSSGGGGGASGVSSYNGRAGTVTPAIGDYSFSQINGLILFTQFAQNGATANQVPSWNGSAWVPITLTPGGVTAFNGRVGSVVPVVNDYSFSLISGTLALNQIAPSGATLNQVLTWNGSNWVPQAPSGGGGASSFSALTDFVGTRTSSTTFTINPGVCRVGWNTHIITTTATITVSGGTGVAYVGCDQTGTLTVYHNLTASCTNCTAVGSTTTFPAGSLPLWFMSATSGTWDAGNGIDLRASQSSQPITQGSCALVTNATGPYVVAFNSACLANIGGVNAQTANYTLLSSDSGKLVTVNGTTLTATLPNPPPSATWVTWIENLNASPVTVSPNSLNINGAVTSITLQQFDQIKVFTDGSNYYSDVPLVQGSNITLTPASNGKTIAASGGGGGGGLPLYTFNAFYYNPTSGGVAPGAAYSNSPNATGDGWFWKVGSSPTAASTDASYLIKEVQFPAAYAGTPVVTVYWSPGVNNAVSNVGITVGVACSTVNNEMDGSLSFTSTNSSSVANTITFSYSYVAPFVVNATTPGGCGGKPGYIKINRNNSIASTAGLIEIGYVSIQL